MKQRKNKKDGVCPPESTEKEDRVCPSEFILKHQHEDQSKVQREPESPPTPESEAESGYSGLSFRSDWSKDVIIDFKSGQHSAVRSPAGSDSPFSVYSYPSCGSNRSTDTDLDFNFRRPTPPESLRRTCEEILHHQEVLLRQQEVQRQKDIQLRQQEVKNLQEALLHQQETFLRQQEVQRQEEVKNLQEALLHWQAVQHQQEVKNLQEAILQQKALLLSQEVLRQQDIQHLQKVIRQKEIEFQAERKAKQEAKRELKLKRLEDQQHLNSGKNNSHKPKRKCPGSTCSSSEDDVSYPMCSSSKDQPEPPGSTRSSSKDELSDVIRSLLEDQPEEFIPSLSEVEFADYYYF